MNKVLELVPEIFYDIIARIIPGSLVMIITLVFTSFQVNSHPDISNNYLLETFKFLIDSKLFANIRTIPETLIIFIGIIISYFTAIILNSLWLLLGSIKNRVYYYYFTLGNYIRLSNNSFNFSRKIPNYSSFLDYQNCKSQERLKENLNDEYNYPQLSFLPSDILQLQITKVVAEVIALQTILMSLLIFLLIQIFISFRFQHFYVNDWECIGIILFVFGLLVSLRNSVRAYQQAMIRKRIALEQ